MEVNGAIMNPMEMTRRIDVMSFSLKKIAASGEIIIVKRHRRNPIPRVLQKDVDK